MITMITKEELEKRLKFLEKEQENQTYALDKLKYLDNEVERLEKALLEIENYRIKNPQDSEFQRNNPETERLERELAQMDTEEQNALKNSQKASPSISSQGYIICLMFNPKSPPEWSGKAWMKEGQGTAYNLEEAKLLYQQLKKKWPNYPLKIIPKND